MYVEDLKEVLRTNLTTTKKWYSHGWLRMELQLFMQIAGFTANRPHAVLNLCSYIATEPGRWSQSDPT